MDAQLAALRRSMDPKDLGKRIKAARLAAGLTQAELAGEEISTAYVSRIEGGQRRPDSGVLERLAERLKVSPDELIVGSDRPERLELQFQLDYAELAMASGDARTALASATQVLDRANDVGAVDLERSARLVRAAALEATGDLDEAILALEDLTSQPTADANWLKSLIALSRCYRETGDLKRAIAVGEQASELIASLELEGLTEAIQLTVTIAGAYMVRGDIAFAMRICLRAIEAAERHGSTVGKASAYWNASLIESRQGAQTTALALARKALTLFEVGEDARNLARLRAQLANIQLRLDPPDAAGAIETLAQADREMSWAPATTYDIASSRLTRSHALFLLGRTDDAVESLDETAAMAPENAPLLRASITVLQGRIAASRGRIDDARAAYQVAVQTLSGIGADREAAQLWFELGDLLSELGETSTAVDAFRRAAASTGLAAPAQQTNCVPVQQQM